MNLLTNLLALAEGDDLDSISSDMMKDIQKNIKDGAKDQEQMWANALELVHKAYEVAGVDRPEPDLRNAWKQYEENLQLAVAQLAKERGMDGDWRMSSAVFREAMEGRAQKFRVIQMGSDFGKGHTIHAKNMEEIIEQIKKSNGETFDTKVVKSTDGDNPRMVTLEFSKFGIRKNYKIRIQQL